MNHTSLTPSVGPDARLPPAGPRRPPTWIADSAVLAHAFSLAESAHRSQNRSNDGRPFLDHVTEVARLLRSAGFDEELVTAGLLHDAVERGTLTEEVLRAEVSESVCALVLALTEDPAIASFDQRKAALRKQVAGAGERALTVFAADKLSDIRGLRWGIEAFGSSLEDRLGTSLSRMEGHYRDSVAMIERATPSSPFLPALHMDLRHLASESARRRRLG